MIIEEAAEIKNKKTKEDIYVIQSFIEFRDMLKTNRKI